MCENCESVLDKIEFFCESCGWPLEISSSFCKHCTEKHNFNYIYFMFFYRGPIRALVKEIKFNNNVRAIYYFKKLINSVDLTMKINYDLIVSVPSHWLRKIARLRHPSDIIAKELSVKYGIPFEKVLKRKRFTKYQWKLGKGDRFRNVNGVFATNKKVKGLKILLVDDIYTTGATIEEASKVLKKADSGIVDCFVLSKSFI